MSAIKKLAAFYSKFWYQDADNTWTISDNAPHALGAFLRGLPPTTGRPMIYEALRTLASDDVVAVPTTVALLGLLGSHPAAVARCDALLASRQPPKTLGTLLRGAYLAEVAEVQGLVRTFIQAELAKY